MAAVSDLSRVSALLVAAGRGERLGAALPKAFAPIGGRPLIAWSLDALVASGVGEIVIAMPPVGTLPEDFVARAEDSPQVRKAAALVLPAGVITVPGGAERSHSARAALGASSGDPILIHDAARPLVTPALVAQSVAGLLAEPTIAAAIVAAPVTDTIKRSADGVTVDGTVPRAELFAVQTPQVFRRSWLERALGQPDEILAAATDDAALVEALGGRVVLVPSTPRNLKLTTPHDVDVVEMLLRQQ